MLDLIPADVGDKLDTVYAACLQLIKFHTSMKTIFLQTRSRSPRRNALGGDEVQRYISTFLWYNLLELKRLEKIGLPPVYISARVNILHGPIWMCVEELDDVTTCNQLHSDEMEQRCLFAQA